jgi:hypothetical protein
MTVKLTGVTLTNKLGIDVEVFVSNNQDFKLHSQQSTPKLDGNLRTIDVLNPGGRQSYDLTGKTAVFVKDESPYTVHQVIDSDGRTLLLVIKDNRGDIALQAKPS